MRGRASGAHGALVIKGCTEGDINADGVGASRRPFYKEGGGKLRPRLRCDWLEVTQGIPIAWLAHKGRLQKLFHLVFPLGLRFPNCMPRHPAVLQENCRNPQE